MRKFVIGLLVLCVLVFGIVLLQRSKTQQPQTDQEMGKTESKRFNGDCFVSISATTF